MTDAEVFTIPIEEAYPMKDTIIVATQEEMDAVIADAPIAHRIEVRGNGLISVNPQCPLDVLVFDSVTVTACGSAAVWAYDSSAVTACDSSAVTAYGSSAVHAYDSSAVTASDSSTVHACDSSAVHATAAGVTITIHTTTDATTPTRWATENGASVSGGEVKLYKALPDDLTSGLLYGHPTVWAVGEEVTCDDWRADDECGGGLHLSPTPGHAWQYLDYETRPRFLECVALIDTIIPLHGDVAKCKTPRVRVVREVDVMGHQVTSEEAAS